jgi:hypothetical protein
MSQYGASHLVSFSYPLLFLYLEVRFTKHTDFSGASSKSDKEKGKNNLHDITPLGVMKAWIN